MKKKKLISIVSPVYNESEGILWFHKSLCDTLSSIKTHQFEIIYVNDGSKDHSLDVMLSVKPHDHLPLFIVDLSRNFGKEQALSAGIQSAHGDAVLMLDSDGQHPLRYIKTFIKQWEDGAEVIVGVRKSNKKEGIVKRYGSKVFYKLFNGVSTSELVPGSTDFRLIDRCVVDEFIKLTEHNRMTRSLIDWLGFERKYVYFDADERQFGTASYTVRKLFELAINTFVSLSAVPLFLAGYIGLFFMAVSFVLGLFVFIEQILLPDPLHLAITGSAMLGLLILFLVGVILSAQGLLGVYISRLLAEGQGRPLYIIRKTTEIRKQ